MKKNRLNINHLFLGIILLAAFFLLNAFVRKEIKNLNNEIVKAEQELKVRNQSIEDLMVAIQVESREDRIVPMAEEKLGLVRSRSNFDSLRVSKQQIDQIKNIIKSKYE